MITSPAAWAREQVNGASANDALALVRAMVDAGMVRALREYVTGSGELGCHAAELVAASRALHPEVQPNRSRDAPPCAGRNCGATDGYSHSIECLAETCAAQAWR